MTPKNALRDEIMEYMRQASYKPMSYQELLEALGAADNESAFTRALGRLEKEGEIVKTRKGKYGLPEMMNLMRGTISMTSKGYAFLIPDQPGVEDVFIYGRDLNGAMHGDRVLIRISRPGHGEFRAEGEVVRVTERENQELVGTYQVIKKVTQVVPDDQRLSTYPVYVKRTKKTDVKDGDKVVVRITTWPGKDTPAQGNIVEVLGREGDPGVDMECVIRKHRLRDEFAEEVLDEARAVARPVGPEDMSGRRDLRHVRMVTIDGEDARDLDDAVSIARWKDGGYELGVHIADVSHYVREDSPLDKEAVKRGTSVYLADRVLPMLPPLLSNGICSLNAGEPRLAFSCVMRIDKTGEVRDYEIFRSVIEVDERMTYTAVNRILRGDEELRERYSRLVEDFLLMRELAVILRNRREVRGALDFDFPEAKVILDVDGRPLAIKKRVHDMAEQLIEEFMIKANEVVAQHLFGREIPALYRVHEKPAPEKIAELNQVLGIYGLRLDADHLDPKAVQAVLKVIKGRPEERIISTLVLRAMRHARYTPMSLGHFGLASSCYCHFTSPIRRYPDLVVHRSLALAARPSGFSERKKGTLASRMTSLGEQCTMREMVAEEAERESIDLKKAQYMYPFVGRVFAAHISSVTAFGFFVELSNTVEGLVHISSLLDDYYIFDDRAFALYGKHSGRKFALGDPVLVKLTNVNVTTSRIDFELYEGDEEPLDLDSIQVEAPILTPRVDLPAQAMPEKDRPAGGKKRRRKSQAPDTDSDDPAGAAPAEEKKKKRSSTRTRRSRASRP